MAEGDIIDRRGSVRVLCAASILCLVLGSVHAFSVFLEPLEARFSVPRGQVSLTYSFALVALTLAVLGGHRLFARLSAGRLVLLVCLVAASGALLAAGARGLVGVWIGYSLLFGAANGLGYAFGLQSAARASPGREGFAMGVVTAAYALGAALSPVMFAGAMAWGGFSAAMIGLAGALILIAPVCAGLMGSFRTDPPGEQAAAPDGPSPYPVPLLWLCYGTGVAAGLMAIGHASGIASAAGWRGAAWVPPALIALSNMGGSFAGGALVDRTASFKLLIGLPFVSALALLITLVSQGGVLTLAGLAVVGLAYGATIAVFPAALAKLFGVDAGARVYAWVFTAWGTAGLCAPWLAGVLYDRTGGYTAALSAALGLSVVSALVAGGLWRRARLS